jgi:cell division topological specificity factor
MSLFGGLFGANKSANVAKDRLLIMLSHERAQNSFAFIEQMRSDILDVVKRYVVVRDVHISTHKDQKIDRLEIQIELDNVSDRSA